VMMIAETVADLLLGKDRSHYVLGSDGSRRWSPMGVRSNHSLCVDLPPSEARALVESAALADGATTYSDHPSWITPLTPPFNEPTMVEAELTPSAQQTMVTYTVSVDRMSRCRQGRRYRSSRLRRWTAIYGIISLVGWVGGGAYMYMGLWLVLFYLHHSLQGSGLEAGNTAVVMLIGAGVVMTGAGTIAIATTSHLLWGRRLENYESWWTYEHAVALTEAYNMGLGMEFEQESRIENKPTWRFLEALDDHGLGFSAFVTLALAALGFDAPKEHGEGPDPTDLTCANFVYHLLEHVEWSNVATCYGLSFRFAETIRTIDGDHEGLEFSIRQEGARAHHRPPVWVQVQSERIARVRMDLPGAKAERVWARAGKGDSGNPVLDMLIDSQGIPESVVEQVIDLVHGRGGVIEKGSIRVLWDGDLKVCLQTLVRIGKALE